MKKLLIYLALLLSFFNCQVQKKGIIGQLENYSEDHKVYLLQISNPDQFYATKLSLLLDSSEIDIKGRFEFTNFNDLDTSFIYRLNIVNKNEKPMYVLRDYEHNNYVFVVNEKVPLFRK